MGETAGAAGKQRRPPLRLAPGWSCPPKRQTPCRGLSEVAARRTTHRQPAPGPAFGRCDIWRQQARTHPARSGCARRARGTRAPAEVMRPPDVQPAGDPDAAWPTEARWEAASLGGSESASVRRKAQGGEGGRQPGRADWGRASPGVAPARAGPRRGAPATSGWRRRGGARPFGLCAVYATSWW